MCGEKLEMVGEYGGPIMGACVRASVRVIDKTDTFIFIFTFIFICT